MNPFFAGLMVSRATCSLIFIFLPQLHMSIQTALFFSMILVVALSLPAEPIDIICASVNIIYVANDGSQCMVDIFATKGTETLESCRKLP